MATNELRRWHNTKCDASNNTIFTIYNAIHGSSIAIIGNICDMYLTCGDSNDIMFKLCREVKHYASIHFYIDEITYNAMSSNRIMNKFMTELTVVIHIVKDWGSFHIGDEMKFDTVIMNPPFSSGLHLKILQGVIPHVNFKHSGKVVCIHPAAWMQFPTRERPDFMNGLIEYFDMLERQNANKMFGINTGDLIITELSADGMSFSGSANNDPHFCCFKYNSRFVNNWKIVQSIYDKVITKCPVETLKNNSAKPDIKKYPLKYYTTRFVTCDYNENGGNNGFRICSQNYQTAIENKIVAGAKFLNFNTEQERYNAWQSYLTKFARFCIAMDESTKLAPYMGDYTQPWDDQRFYKYFGLTDVEINVIENTIQ